jgi:glycosyltransferase involved in cell wall biosynthesis
MKILHATNMILPIAGIIDQMSDEQEAANLLGLHWKSRMFCSVEQPSDLFVLWEGNPSNRLGFKRGYYRWLQTMVHDVDVLLLRYTPYDPIQYRFLKRCCKPIYIVLHTKYGWELASKRGMIGKLQAFAESLIGPACIRMATGVIAVTSEIGRSEAARAGAQTVPILYPNGVFWDEASKLVDRRFSEVPELAFVSSKFATWHGLDLLLDSIAQSTSAFYLHLIGELPDDLTALAEREERCIIHGQLSRGEINSVLASCWIGITSLAHFRLGMNQACPLKTREYLRLGLPVYGSYEEVFPGDMPFYKQGPCDIEKIVEFAKSMRRYGRGQVVVAARQYIDKAFLVESLYRELETRCAK